MEDRLPQRRQSRRGSFFLSLVALLRYFLIAAVFHAMHPLQAAALDRDEVQYLNENEGVEYVGDESCRACHASQYDSFKGTGMGRSMSLPSRDKRLGEFDKPATFQDPKTRLWYSTFERNGKFHHRLYKLDARGRVILSEDHPIAYAVGSGDHGRSYLVARGNFLFISPLSWYTLGRKWDLSPGNDIGIYEGFSREAGDLCISCHSGLPRPIPGAVNQYRQPVFQIMTIGCERCHGPGELHVKQRRVGAPIEGATDRTIVNPAKLTGELRDDVCFQCHLAGDARVPRPGKHPLDFRPGSYLDNTVAVFSVPLNLKGGSFLALNQTDQIQMSRCRLPNGEALNCITCHDPHKQLHGQMAAEFFNSRCLQCHNVQSCTAAGKLRQATSPPDNCTSCHMPRRKVVNIGHTALTDHRIPKSSNVAEKSYVILSPDPATNLIWETKPPGAQEPDLRTLALAFAQLASDYPGYGAKGFPLLVQAAQKFPGDPEVQATYAEVLLAARPSSDFRELARAALERSIAAGSKSPLVRRRLGELLAEMGGPRALEYLKEAVELDPYDPANYLALANVEVSLGQTANAERTMRKLVEISPANEDARHFLEQSKR